MKTATVRSKELKERIETEERRKNANAAAYCDVTLDPEMERATAKLNSCISISVSKIASEFFGDESMIDRVKDYLIDRGYTVVIDGDTMLIEW